MTSLNKHQNLIACRKLKGCTIDCKINLDELLETNEERKKFDSKWKDFLASDPLNKKIYRKKGNLLTYKSEQLISFEGNKKEHRFWKSILKPAGVLDLPYRPLCVYIYAQRARRHMGWHCKYS